MLVFRAYIMIEQIGVKVLERGRCEFNVGFAFWVKVTNIIRASMLN